MTVSPNNVNKLTNLASLVATKIQVKGFIFNNGAKRPLLRSIDPKEMTWKETVLFPTVLSHADKQSTG